MSVSRSPRDAIREVFAALAPGATPKQLREAERELIKALVPALVADGYTLAMAGAALGVPVTTLRSWRTRDDGFGEELDVASTVQRKWLIGQLRERLEVDGTRLQGVSGVGQAINVLSHLAFPELRNSKVEVDDHRAPTPGESKDAVLGILNKAKPLELPGTTPAPVDTI